MSHTEIFNAAVKLPAGERAGFLQCACGSDRQLLELVESLLHAHDAPDTFLRDPVERTAEYRATAERPGDVAGPYKLLEQVGEGGFGVVYVAEQTHPVRRKVAVKVLKPGMDTRQVVARFEAERQALAIMDHPHIARVYDGGATDAGRPFFVMELVKGVPVTDYCDRNRLPLPERLELFAQVCGALQHAHQKGIIHRDIKPSNVLVSRHDTTPVVKVIDFGVAKALGQELTDKTLHTGVAQMVGTPLYMSPEQAGMSDLDVDTRSDIYSLGVLLYELLTGTTPFEKERFTTAGYDEIRRIIREEDPPRPSTRLSTLAQAGSTVADARGTDPRRLSKVFRGELDWVVMKALEKDRNRRYETAAAFTADVQRYLADEPVLACPPTAWYRARKFARRNRRALVPAAVLAIAVVVALGGIAGSVGWATRDRAARQAAVEKEAALALAEAELWAEQEKWPEALDAAKRSEGLLAGSDGDLRERVLELRRDLEMLIRLEGVRLLVTDLRGGWHEWDAVHDGYANAFAEYGVNVLGLPVEDAAVRIRARDRLALPLAGALDVWSCTKSLKTANERGRLRAVAAAADPDPWRRRVREAVQRKDGAALAELAGSPDLARQPRTSVGLLEHGLRHCGHPGLALDVLRKTQRAHSADFWANYLLAHELFWLANADFREVVSFARAAVAARPKSAAAHLLLALALQRLRKLDEAVPHHLEALALAPDNPFAHHDYGGTLYIQGKYEEALAAYQKAIDLWPGNHHAYHFRGLVYSDLKKLDEAVANLRKSTELNPNGPYAGLVHVALANTLISQGKHDEAIEALLRFVELCPHDGTAPARWRDELCRFKSSDQAAAALNRAVERCPTNAWLHYHVACALIDLDRTNESLAVFDRGLAIDPNNPHLLHNRGAALLALGRFREAIDYCDRAIVIDPADLWAHLTRGRALQALGHMDDAVTAFRKGTELGPSRRETHLFLANALYAQRKYDDAFRSYKLAARTAGGGTTQAHARIAVELNKAAYRLANDPSPVSRHPATAAELSREAVRVMPLAAHWRTLGVAEYRAGSFTAAASALDASIRLSKGGDGLDWFFLAMVRWQLGQPDDARRCYDRAAERLDKNQTADDLRRACVEAEQLLGVRVEHAPPPRLKK